MKKLFAFILSVSLLLMSIPLSAFSATAQKEYGNFEYGVTDNEIRIIGYDKTEGCPSRIVIPSKIEGLPVSEIGFFAFANFDDLESVEIPSGVKSIGDRAFENCGKLSDVSIPDTLTVLGSYAFSKCTSLKSVKIPQGLKTVGDFTFYGCEGLTDVCIPNGIIGIGNSAFAGCKNLKTVSFPNSIESIGPSAFEECENLTAADIPESVIFLGSGAFSRCVGLKSVTLQSGLTDIGDFALYNCTGLTSVTVPESVTNVGKHAFSECESLKTVNFLSYNAEIDGNAFSECIFTMRCQEGSTAETFAKKYGIACEIVKFSLRDEASGITLTNKDGSAFDKDTLLLVQGISDNETLQSINSRLSGQNLMPFNISLLKYGTVIRPVKEVTLSVPADSGMKSEYCKVYSAAQDGNLAEIRSVCRGDKIIFSVTSLGNFVIAEQFPVEGDVSGDGRVTAADALMVLQYCVGAIEFDERQTNSADVDLSGRVDTTDALMILQFTVKKIDKFPSRR